MKGENERNSGDKLANAMNVVMRESDKHLRSVARKNKEI